MCLDSVKFYDVRKLCRNTRSRWKYLVNDIKTGVFGHRSGLPGEEEWLKPLQGPSRTRWYWPSKYLHFDFTLRHYLSMQVNRFKPKQDDPAIYKLWETVNKFNKYRNEIKTYMQSVDEDTFNKSTTLQDTHALYTIIFKESPLSFKFNDPTLRNEKYAPFINYALKCDRARDASISASVRVRNRLRVLLESDPHLKDLLMLRNRFVDGLYLRRRAYHLDKVVRHKPISESRLKYRNHFLSHPDDKTIWPDNKGITQHAWPSR